MTTKNILVTGGLGFIGSHIVDKLLQNGHSVTVLDNLEYQVHRGIFPRYWKDGEVEIIIGDVRNHELVENVLKDKEIIFHEAALVGVGQSMYQIKRYMDANVMGTATLLDAVVNSKTNVKKMMVASSMSIYGEGAYVCESCGEISPELRGNEQLARKDFDMHCPHCGKITRPVHTTETKIVMPNSVYAVSKRDQEELFLSTGRAYGIDAVALRYFNVYGPRQSLNNPYTGVCAIFSSMIKNNNPPLVFEDGLQSRDFVDVQDIADANIFVMNNNNAKGVYNIGTGQPVTILQIANMLAKLYGKQLTPSVTNNFREGDIRHCFADISRIKQLGWQPKVIFEDGIKQLVEWGETQRATDMVENAASELKKHGLIKG
ncbi:MAG: NAD-dependent epimerase/dehydratase family protein [Candidatus Aenigmatarchaeota archaeon]